MLRDGSDWRRNTALETERLAVESGLAGTVRVVIRAYGSESVLRLMVEASEAGVASQAAERLAAAARAG